MREAATTDGLDAGALAAMDAALAGRVDEGLPGLVTLVARGDEVHVTAAGAQDFGGAPMRRDTIFRIASMTKPIAAATTMALVEEGRLRLDEPVGRLLPEFAAPRVLARIDGPIGETVPAERPILVEDLLTMRMGRARCSIRRRRSTRRSARRGWRRGRGCRSSRVAMPTRRRCRFAADAAAGGALALRDADAAARGGARAGRRQAACRGDGGEGLRPARDERHRLLRAGGQARPAGDLLVADYGTGVFEVFDGAGPDSRFAKPPAFPIA